MKLVGCGTALVTPFRADGAVDEPALRALVDWQIGQPQEAGSTEKLPAGVDWLVACGTTGETPTLSHAEWAQVIRVVAAQAALRVPVWAGCSSNSTREAVERAQEAAAIPGVSAILTANPFYNKPGQEGQFQHFQAVAQAVAPFPVVLYNIPGRTGVNLEPATVVRLAESCDNIVAVKESSGNMAQIAELLCLLPRTFQVYAGDDAMCLGVLGAGGAGLISVTSNVLPREIAGLVQAALRNDWATARSLNHTCFPLMVASFLEPSPGPVKALLAMMGKLHETYRLPMMPVTAATRERLHALASGLGLLDQVESAAAAR
ncbi:4-hydroxy-tetrahydrodipicolinate synthase [Acidipila sp. EB88]|uniref:4-hydroxy-tetrahydrodipicolinate synthase n=1 Tax=Acidipila sp. EB88 TaxID=2305226 RepID=UPI000F5F38E9|nr:4-hydroxy-tetrahydrodipicolinate synthase [Acidipila sp. EB88]RRA48802.1 4-hydroxy-tetrahydrodipicolinate synthase [Acidipila sp. EB88]